MLLSVLRSMAAGFRSLFRNEQVRRELDEELRGFLEMAAEGKMKQGIAPQDALRAVRLERGSLEVTKEFVRSAPWEFFVQTCWQDLRFAIRMLRKSPGFTAVAVLTLALGIGLNAAIFALVDSAFLRPLPFREPERLVHVWTTDAAGDPHTPLPEQYLALRKYGQVFEQVAGIGLVDNFYGDDDSGWQNLPGLVVSQNWLTTLGIQPLLGRDFVDEEQTLGRNSVVILSYNCWHTRFHADPHIVGKRLVLNREPVTIVGVMPQSLEAYHEYDDIQIFAPLVFESYSNSSKAIVAGSVRLRILGRLKPGVTLDQARAETEGIAEGLRKPAASVDRSGHLVVEDFAEGLRHIGPTAQNARRGLWMTAAAAGVVLLIACANVASLLLARGVNRHREVAVRTALGCSRQRMIRQLLTENTLLFLCGASLGLLAAQWSAGIINRIASGIAPNGSYPEVNARVLMVGLLVSLLSALFFGMIPAFHATRVNVNDSLKDGALSASTGSRSRRARNLLVISQIALGMVLLVSLGLLFRSLLNAESAPFGFDPHDVLTATADLQASRYAGSSVDARVMQAAADLGSSPGIASVGITDYLPMDGADSGRFRIDVPETKSTPVEDEIYFVSVSPGYFSTLRIPMYAGRTFQESDTPAATPVAIVNQTFAKMYFPGANPIGHHIASIDSPTVRKEIVGVVSDFRQRNPEEDFRPMAYFPILQALPRHWSIVIRARGLNDMRSAARDIRRCLRNVDPQLYWQLSSMQRQIHEAESLTLRRPIITLLVSFGSLALVLVVIGAFGVTSYSVGERTREIGIRVALGAARVEIVGLVLRESIRVLLLGLTIGTLGAFAIARFFPTEGIGWSGSGIFLYGVSRTDSLTYSLAALLLAGVVLAASWAPARRATRVDPIVALHHG
jgi:putative ABC transport system permease protein